MPGFSERLEATGRAGIARARAELAAAGVDPTPDTVAEVVDLDPETRAARLRRRAQARTLGRIDQPTGDDAA